MEFVDCPTCGKRVATTAKICRHCGQPPYRAGTRDAKHQSEDAHSDNSEEHHALSIGGYTGEDDDFDYEEFVESELDPKSRHARPKQTRTWVWVTGWLLIIATLLPYFLTLVIR